MNQLQPEMVFKIFKHLNLVDLINCKKVNKYFYFIVSSNIIKIRSLIVIDYRLDEMKGKKWYFTNESINHQDLCNRSHFLTTINQQLLSQLKHLYIDFYLRGFDMNELNNFSQLVHLEIHCEIKNDEINLNLPELKILFFDPCIVYEEFVRAKISICCPKLEVLCFHDRLQNPLVIEHPESIKHLNSTYCNFKLIKFQNLEQIVTTDYRIFNSSFFIFLKKLKEVHFDVACKDMYSIEFERDVDDGFMFMKDLIDSTVVTMISQGLTHIKLFFSG